MIPNLGDVVAMYDMALNPPDTATLPQTGKDAIGEPLVWLGRGVEPVRASLEALQDLLPIVRQHASR